MVLVIAGVACGEPGGVGSGDGGIVPASMPGLTASELRRYQAGLGEFMETDVAAEGLGPLFNGNSCAQCHNLPGPGGAGLVSVVRAMCADATGALHEPPGGSLIPLFSTRPDIGRARIPAGCTLVEHRRTTSVLGAGLIEAIPDEQIVAVAAEQAAADVGTAGRVAFVDEEGTRRVGRLGWKGQHASLRVFAADAYRNEMGITNELFPTENAPGADQSVLALMDWVNDPEARVGAIDALADFMRFVAPPLEVQASDDGLRTDGGRLFISVGCATCHRPSYTTELHDSAALAGRTVPLFSDLLLHDVGTGSVVPQAGAGAAELRTPPLWGLGAQSLLLHDGRATSIEQAVLAHGGQATTARAAFERLTDTERGQLLAFLNGL